MLYSAAENRRWWDSLVKWDQSRLVSFVIEKAGNPAYKNTMAQLQRRLMAGGLPTDKDLEMLRKWAPK